jgi:uncharacterized protein YpuA (DUF1002 family)
VVALGQDLTASQRATVLSLMGLTEDDLSKCTVIYTTNAEEHEFLDSYIDPSIIGKRALTSVKMTKAAAGSGIKVTTQNVNYCTTGMYRNALLTAGVEDRDFLIVAPFPVSGTAGLIGAVRAYEATADKKIEDKKLDAALDEMITTGELNEKLEGVSNEDVEALMAWLKSMIATGKLDTSDETSIRNTIAEGEKQFNVKLTDAEKDQIVSLLKKLSSLGLNGSYLIDQAENLYSKYGSDVVNQAQDVIDEAVKNAVTQAAGSFFSSLKDSVTGFFGNLFKK